MLVSGAADRRLRICCGPLVLAATDAAITLYGQAPEYWTEGYQVIHEHNPVGYWLLAVHPLAFLVGVCLWMVFFVLLIIRLPAGLARVVAYGVILGHAVGASTWLLQIPYGVLGVIALFLVARYFDGLVQQLLQSSLPESGDRPPV